LRLARRALVLTYDCRGHGASGRGEPRYSVEQFADDLADLMSALKWEKALVAGASMGGCIALALCKRHEARVGSLGLIDTTAWYGEQAPAQWEERAQKALQGGLRALVDFQVTRWFSDDFRAAQPEVVAASVATFVRNDPQAYAASCRMLGAADLRPALARIRVPTAVVVGEQDYATPVGMAESLHSNIKGSTLNVLHNARHLTPLEKPGEVAAELERLIQ
jgi:3-oxoadipate enol-lactonase